jgi:cytochrome P450
MVIATASSTSNGEYGEQTNPILLLSIVIGSLFILIWYFHFQYGEKRTQLKNGHILVRLARLPFLGIALGLTPQNMIFVFEELYRKYGDFVEIYLGPQKLTLVTDVDIARELLNARPKVFRRVRSLDYPAQQLGYLNALFFAHGQEWNTARRLTSPSFNKENVASHIIDMWQIENHWAEEIKASSSSSTRNGHKADSDSDVSRVIEFKDAALEFTLRVITKVAFGIDRESSSTPNTQNTYGSQLSYFNQKIFVEDIQSQFSFLMESIIFPLPRFLWKWSPWHFQKYEQRALDGNQRFSQACLELIRQQKAKHANDSVNVAGAGGGGAGGQSTSCTLLDTLLRKAERDQISDVDVLTNVKLFYLAGSETTSIGICFAMYYLALHAAVKVRVYEEVCHFYELIKEQTARKHTDLFDLIFEQLKWTEAVFKEALRLQSPATFIGLTLEQPNTSYQLSNGFVIGPNDEVGVFIEGILRCSEECFEDSSAFKPERWLDPDVAKREKAESLFMTFGGGPRVCPGAKLAMIEGILAVAALVYHLDWKLACDPKEIKRVLLISSTPNKMPLILWSRENTDM